MTRKYAAFDLEIAKSLPEGETDWKRHRPLGITCAAIQLSDRDDPHLFGDVGCDRMSAAECVVMVRHLVHYQRIGYQIVTWNGLSFDFDILAEESKLHRQCAGLARSHIDMMFHLFCLRGHYLGLDKCAKGLGLVGKLEGVNGAMAPQMWIDGDRERVLDYVAQDVRTTLDVALAVEEKGAFIWTSSKGRLNVVDVDKLLTVDECLSLPLPDTSWMVAPVDREEFLEWMGSN